MFSHLKGFFSYRLLKLLSSLLPDYRAGSEALKDLDTSEDGVVSFDEFKAYLAHDAHPEEAIEVPLPELHEAPEPPVEVEDLEALLRRCASSLNRSEACYKRLFRGLEHPIDA